MRSWALTLVIPSAGPLLMFIQALSQGFASPLLSHEREQTGISATIIECAIAAIATVKVFNAADMESQRANDSFRRPKTAATKLNRVWGTTSGIAQFVMMGMYRLLRHLLMFNSPRLPYVSYFPHRRSEIAHVAQDHPNEVLWRTPAA